MSIRQQLGSWFAPLMIHGLNQHEAMQRALVAKAQGLDPSMFGTPFPGGTVTNTTTNNGGGFLKPALATAALLAAGLGSGIVTAKVLAPSVAAPATTPTATAAPTPFMPAPGTPYDAVVEEQQPDGSWKEIDRKHLSPGK